jgi:streptogramin lyase
MINADKLICSLLLCFTFSITCNGQNATALTNLPLKDSVQVSSAETKIVLPEGTDMQGSFRCSMQDKAGHLWFGTTGAGLYRYDPFTKTFVHFSEKDGLPNAAIYSIAEDKAGNIWLGTGNGIYHREGNTFVRLQNPVSDNENLHLMNGVVSPEADGLPWSFAVHTVICDKSGNIWFGTGGYGLWHYDLSEKSLTNFQYADGAWRTIPGDSVKYFARKRSGLVQCIMEDKNGKIWFSAAGYSMLNCYDPQGARGKSFIAINAGSLSKNSIFSMVQDRSGNIWCATRDNGVCYFDPSSVLKADSSSVVWFGKKDGLLDNASCLLEDKNGNTWIGSVGKLCDASGRVAQYNPTGGKSFTPLPIQSLSSNNIWTMLEDKAGNIWFGTRDMGLYRYDLNKKSFTAFSGTVSGQ